MILETDSLILTQPMKDNSYRLAMVDGAILELKNFIRENFSFCEISFVPRSCNKAVDALATLGYLCSQEIDLAWNGTPSCIGDLVANDFAESLS